MSVLAYKTSEAKSYHLAYVSKNPVVKFILRHLLFCPHNTSVTIRD